MNGEPPNGSNAHGSWPHHPSRGSDLHLKSVLYTFPAGLKAQGSMTCFIPHDTSHQPLDTCHLEMCGHAQQFAIRDDAIRSASNTTSHPHGTLRQTHKSLGIAPWYHTLDTTWHALNPRICPSPCRVVGQPSVPSRALRPDRAVLSGWLTSWVTSFWTLPVIGTERTRAITSMLLAISQTSDPAGWITSRQVG